MIVKGVGRNGEKVEVAGDFSAHVPFGWCYGIDEYASDGDPVFTVFHPASRPNGYKEGSFDLDEGTSCEVIFKFNQIGTVTVAEDATEMDVDIDNILEQQSDNAKNISIGTALGALFGSENDEDDEEDGFRRLYKVVKNDSFLKVGYFTSGFLGETVYNVLLFTSHHVYSAVQIRFLEDEYNENEGILESILSSFEPLNIKEYKKPEEQINFSQPLYSNKIRAKVGPLAIVLPDGFEYVTEEHIPANDSKASNVLEDYAMVAAPADCKGGLRNFRDASLGINVSEPQQVGLSEDAWNNINTIKKRLNSNNQGRKLKYVKEGVNYLIGYGKGNECEAGDEPYWVSYFAVVLCGSLQYTVNLYFNSKKASASEYNKAVEMFCANIMVNADDLEETEAGYLREELGDMLAENGRMKGILASQLYTKDIIFNNDDEVTYDGTHTIISGFQLNSAVMDEYPNIVNHAKSVVQELKRIITFVEQNENLMIPKSKFHPNILKATRNNPITGATVFELCAWHMLLITESEKNKYVVAIDNNLIKGIPDAFSFVGEYIKTLRAYNEIYDDFEVTYASTLNVDGPCGNISTPVRGAVTGSTKTIKVKGGNQGEFESYAEKLKGIDSVSDEDYVKNEIERLESKVNTAVKNSLKAEAKDAKALFTKISTAIMAKSYKGLDDIDAVIERVNEAVDESTDIMAFNLAYMYRPFVNSYEIAYYAQRVVSDADFGGRIQMVITENTFESGKFAPNEFPKSLSSQMDDLTEETIYIKLLESAEYLIGEGNKIISKVSASYINKQLDEWGNDFEAQGTQYEGRIERIEKVKVGDRFTLKREPDNEYDPNAIDLRTSSGSVGHLPSQVAELLSLAIDAGTISAFAEAIKVEPLSTRSKRPKKPLLNVKIIVSENDSSDSDRKKKTNESTKSSRDDKSLEIEARKKVIAERKKAREARRKLDEKAEKLAHNIECRMTRIENTFERSAEHHKIIIEMHRFEGPWDPKLQECFSMFNDDIQQLGNDAEELLKDAIDDYNEISDIASPSVLISVINAIEDAIDYVDSSIIQNDDIGVVFTYDWKSDIPSLGRELKRTKSELMKKQAKLEAEERKQEEEDRRFEEAQKYGVNENDLDSHKKYLAAKELFDKAKTSKEYEDVAKKFTSIKNYLDSVELLTKCEEKVKTLKPIEEAEKEKKRLNDDLKDYEKALADSKRERSSLDSKEAQLKQDIANAENVISDLEDKFPVSKAKIDSELDTKIHELQLRIEGLREEKTSAEKSIEDMQTQISGLSFFKYKLKKELTQKVEETRDNLPKFTKGIRRLEVDCDDLKKKSSREISLLQQQIENERRILDRKRAELAKVYDEQKVLDANIANEAKKVDDLKEKLQKYK